MRRIKTFYNRYFSADRQFARALYELTGYTPANLSIFHLAFKHSSKSSQIYGSNERLEFLGDAVLDTVISEYLFKKYPLRGEGFLTEMRAKIVNRKRLGSIGENLVLQDLLDYDKGYVKVNSTILGNALEALIGAIYLDGGYEVSKTFVFDKMVTPYIDLEELRRDDINFKSRLFEWAQRFDRALTFEVLEEKVQKNIRIFIVGAYVDGQLLGQGRGRSKKEAQKGAAKKVYIKLNIEEAMDF